MDFLQKFLAEAESYLPTIRGGILVCAQEGNLYGALNMSLRQTGAIKESALIINSPEVAQIAAELEENLKNLVDTKQPLNDKQSRQVLDKLTELEILLAQIRFDTDDSFISIADFVDESFDNLLLNQLNERIEEPTETAEEEFEIDEEMLEIFSLEAEELIQNINTNLKTLEKNPDNREALLEIRRSAHTLKGSAGIVGMKQLSEAAHRVEDLLDYATENDIEANEKIFNLLLISTDCFSALASGEKSPHLTGKLAGLYKDFDRVFAFLKKKSVAGDSNISEFELKPEIVETVLTEDETFETPISISNQPRSIVRVSLEKLDDLVKIIGGLVISRSVFEQRLAELEQQSGELHNSTRRLQQSTNKLETDFEANMLDVQNPKSKVIRQSAEKTRFGTQNSKFKAHLPSAILDSNSFDTLELDRYTDFHQTMRELVETTSDTSAINLELDNLRGNLELLFENQRYLIEEMQDKLMRLRLVSFSSLNVRLQRTVRVACDEEGKLAELYIEGENLEVDTQILDALIEPLLHLLRNAAAHGIEPPETRRLLGKPEIGRIKVRVKSEGTHIILKISDDGRGIFADGLKEKAVRNKLISQIEADKMSIEEAFSLIFTAGLTTADKIGQISGRGVGMNIVKQSIERQQGTISIDSETHRGTTFTLRLPMALAVTRALLVKTNEQTFAFPLKLIKRATEISAAELKKAKAVNALQIGGVNYSIVNLNNLLGLPSQAVLNDEILPILLLENLEKPCALLIDEIIKPEKFVIKPLGKPLQNLPDFLGVTILGDGSVVPVLDLIYLLKQQVPSSKFQVPNQEITDHNHQLAANKKQKTKNKKLKIMIVDDSPSVRHLTSNVIKNAGWTATLAKDGLEALEILQDLRELPDLILTDVEMPRMDGYEFLASLKRQANLQTIPVVMITSRANQKHRQKAFDLGISEYIDKPFDDAALIETIKNLTT